MILFIIIEGLTIKTGEAIGSAACSGVNAVGKLAKTGNYNESISGVLLLKNLFSLMLQVKSYFLPIKTYYKVQGIKIKL